MSRTAFFPGSFDPVTNGHLDLVRQAARLADRVVVAIGTHPGKTPLFSTDERLAMLQETCAPLAREAGCGVRVHHLRRSRRASPRSAWARRC